MRQFQMQARSVEVEGNQEMWLEGYAAVFDSKTCLFSIDGLDYYEQIAKDSFSEAEMENVIFQYDHEGRVFARTTNKTLFLSIDEKGLFMRARVDGTEGGRSLYNDVSNGYITSMSFRFTVKSEAYDQENRTWTILRFKRLYDVSAVSIPAYEDTSIDARKAELEKNNKLMQQRTNTEKARLMLKLRLEAENEY